MDKFFFLGIYIGFVIIKRIMVILLLIIINYFIYEIYSNRDICFIEIEFVICYFFI